MWHLHFLKKRVKHQMNYDMIWNEIKMIWPWEKQVWFHLININWHICTSLDFVISRAKSSENIRREVFLGKSVCCIFSEHLFLRTSMEGCFWKLNKIVLTLFYHLENVTLHSSALPSLAAIGVAETQIKVFFHLSRDHVIKTSRDFECWVPPPQVTTLPSFVVINIAEVQI